MHKKWIWLREGERKSCIPGVNHQSLRECEEQTSLPSPYDQPVQKAEGQQSPELPPQQFLPLFLHPLRLLRSLVSWITSVYCNARDLAPSHKGMLICLFIMTVARSTPLQEPHPSPHQRFYLISFRYNNILKFKGLIMVCHFVFYVWIIGSESVSVHSTCSDKSVSKIIGSNYLMKKSKK